MNKNDIINTINNNKYIDSYTFPGKEVIDVDLICDLIERLDEPILDNVHVVLERLRGLAIRDRETWLRIIMKELGECISDSEYNRGYTKGKLDYAFKDSKPNIPDFISDWIIRSRDIYSLTQAMTCGSIEVSDWLSDEDNQRKFAMAWFYEYRREYKNKKYLVMIKNVNYENYLKHDVRDNSWYFGINMNSDDITVHHTKQELKDNGFEGVFNSPLFEVTEVE